MQLPALLFEPPDNVEPHGSRSGQTVERKAECQLSYLHTGTRHHDILPGRLLGKLWPDGSTTLMDLTASKYVTFVVPADGGTLTALWFCREQDLAPIAAAQDIIPLEEHLQGYWRRWQIRTHGCLPISAPISYLWSTNLGLLYSTDPAHVAWTLPANTDLLGTAVTAPGTITPGGGPFGDVTGPLVESSSQIALSYQDISRLWVVCGTSSGSTPTQVYQSNDNGNTWTQLTLPTLDGYMMVMGVAVDVCDNLYVSVAHGATYGNKLSVCVAAKPYSTWRATLLTDLTASIWVGYDGPHTNEDGNITSAPVACDPLLPGRVIVGACWVTPAWGWSAVYVARNGLSASPIYGVGSIGGDALVGQSQQYLSLDAWQGHWYGAWTQTSSVIWHLSGDYASAGVGVDAWPNYGYNDQWNVVSYRVAQSRVDRRSGYVASLIASLSGTGAFYTDAVLLQKIAGAPAIAKHVLFADHMFTGNQLLDDGTYGLEIGGVFISIAHKAMPSTRRGPFAGLFVGEAGSIIMTPVCDYRDERSVVGAWIGSDAGGTQRQVQIYTYSDGLHADDAVTIAVPTINGSPATPAGVGRPWSLRCRNNNLTTPPVAGGVVPSAPTLLSPAPGTVDLDSYAALATWTAVTDPSVTHYEMQCSHYADFGSDIVLQVSTDDPASPFYSDLISTPTLGGHYYWRVRAMAHSTPGPWSAASDFTVGYPPPVVTAPADGTVFHLHDIGGGFVEATVSIDYVQVAGCNAVELEYGTEFDWVLNGGDSAMSFLLVTDPPHGAIDLPYFGGTPPGGVRWRLRAQGPLGKGSYSEWRHFTVV